MEGQVHTFLLTMDLWWINVRKENTYTPDYIHNTKKDYRGRNLENCQLR
jgi:hypothetical protein